MSWIIAIFSSTFFKTIFLHSSIIELMNSTPFLSSGRSFNFSSKVRTIFARNSKCYFCSYSSFNFSSYHSLIFSSLYSSSFSGKSISIVFLLAVKYSFKSIDWYATQSEISFLSSSIIFSSSLTFFLISSVTNLFWIIKLNTKTPLLSFGDDFIVFELSFSLVYSVTIFLIN